MMQHTWEIPNVLLYFYCISGSSGSRDESCEDRYRKHVQQGRNIYCRSIITAPSKGWMCMGLRCFITGHRFDGCKCTVCGMVRDEQHAFEQCVCIRCGKLQHSYEVVSVETMQGDGCCWDPSQPCIPNCGTPCDNYYDGRRDRHITHYRCKTCGAEKTEEAPADEPYEPFRH